MSVGSLVLCFTSITGTVPLSLSVTKRVLPFGVTTDTLGFEPTAMSGSLVLDPTSITDTVPPSQFGTKAVARHGAGGGIADAPTGNMPTSAPDHPSTKNRRTHRIPASCPEFDQLRSGRRWQGMPHSCLQPGGPDISQGNITTKCRPWHRRLSRRRSSAWLPGVEAWAV